MNRVLFFTLLAVIFSTNISNASIESCRRERRNISNPASFNCSKAKKEIEKIICNDSELSSLDEKMAKAYHAAIALNPEKAEEITKEQKKWLKTREKFTDEKWVLDNDERSSIPQIAASQSCICGYYEGRELKECSLQAYYEERIVNLGSTLKVIPELQELTKILESIRGGTCGRGPVGGHFEDEVEKLLLATAITNPEPNLTEFFSFEDRGNEIPSKERENPKVESYDSFLKTWSKQGIWEQKKYLSLKKVVAQVNENLKNYYVSKFSITPERATTAARYYTNRIVWNRVGTSPSDLEESCNTSDLNNFIKTNKMPSRCDLAELTRIAILYGESKSVVQKLLAATPKKELVARTTNLLSFSANRPEITKLLIKFGAKVNDSQTAFGKTALMYSIQERDLENIKTLVQARAKINQPTRPIPSEEDISKRFDDLMKKSNNRWSDDYRDDYWDYGEWCNIGAGNRTPLMYAAWHGTPEIIKFLIKSGADPKLKDSNGETAYDYLSQNHLDEKDLAEARKLLKI
jgi:uncharacterized protein YecT (DUF1311 family)